MRIACLVTVCSFLLTVTTVQSEHLVRFKVPNFDDVTSGSDLTPSIRSTGQPSKIRLGTQVDAVRRRRNFPEGGSSPFEQQQSAYRRREEVRLPRRSRPPHLGRSDNSNDLQGNDVFPLAAEVMAEESIHLEPVSRLTKKSAIESIVEMIRRVVDPPKSNLGPLIGPVRFPGVGEKVYIRLPEPVQYESNHVLVRLVSPPAETSVEYDSPLGHSLLPATSIVETSVGPTAQHRSSLLPPIASGNLDDPAHRHRYVQSVFSPPAQGHQVHENSVNELDTSSSKDQSSFSSSMTFLTQKARNYSQPVVSRNSAYDHPNGDRQSGNLQTVAAMTSTNEDEDSDDTSRMARIQPAKERLRGISSSPFLRTARRHRNRFSNWVNPSWDVFTGYQKPIPDRNAEIPAVSGNSGNRFSSAEIRNNPLPRPPQYSPPDLKSESNEWRGIAAPYDLRWKNANQRFPSTVNDFRFRGQKSMNPVTTLQQLMKQNKQDEKLNEFSNQTALHIIAAPNLQTIWGTYNKTYNFAKSKENFPDYVTSKNASRFDLSNDASTYGRSRVRNLYEKSNSKKPITLNTLESTDLSENSFKMDESKHAPRFERLESVLKMKEVNGLPKFRISDSYEIEDTVIEPKGKSKESKMKDLIEALKASNREIYNADGASVEDRSKNDPKSKKASQEDILFSIMSMTASQFWKGEPTPPKTKSALGILNIQDYGNKDVDSETLETPKNHREGYDAELADEDFADSSQDEAEDRMTDFQNHGCGNSDEENHSADYSCEYDGESTAETSNESYKDESSTINEQ